MPLSLSPSLSAEQPCFPLFPLSSYALSLSPTAYSPPSVAYQDIIFIKNGGSFYSNNGHPLSHLKPQNKHFMSEQY